MNNAVDAGHDDEVGLCGQNLVDEKTFGRALLELELSFTEDGLVLKVVGDVGVAQQ